MKFELNFSILIVNRLKFCTFFELFTSFSCNWNQNGIPNMVAVNPNEHGSSRLQFWFRLRNSVGDKDKIRLAGLHFYLSISGRVSITVLLQHCLEAR
jgi:hypothetical protein